MSEEQVEETKETEEKSDHGDVKRPGKARVSLLITEEQRDAVEDLARKEGKTMSDAVIDKVTENKKKK